MRLQRKGDANHDVCDMKLLNVSSFICFQAIEAMWIDLAVCVGLRGCTLGLMQDVTRCLAWESTHVKPIVSKEEEREIERIEKSGFLSDSIPFSLCYVTIACQCFRLTWESAEAAKSLMHCALLFGINLFSLRVFLRPDLERVKG